MALVLADRVQETTTTTGTGSVTLLGAVTGFQSFAAVGNTNTCYYTIAAQTTSDWEVGIGTYSTTGPTLARTTVLASSNSGSLVNFPAGTKSVFVTYPSEKSVNLDASGNVTALGTITSGVWNGTTIPVGYGGTGVTTSSGANSVVLRDANQNVTANNFLAGYNVITAAGTTTTLTVASAYYQRISGSTTQTIKLPDATTMVNGQGFTFDNDSSGAVSIIDNASGAIDTVPSGGYSYIFCEDNSTSAGSWGKYALLPASYDFSTTSANFGGAVISNTTYQGTTVASGYGGTGLTTFTAANNALYSTGATTLTAGTLPVLAGGTGVTTSTGSGSSVLNTSPTLVTPLLGTPTSGNLANCTGYPAGSLTGNFVSTFSAGTTGFTPSTATTGAVTLAGTLSIANGGTGSTTAATVAGTGISVSGTFPNQTITNAGVTSLTTSSGLSTNTSATGAVSVTNTGVTSIVAGTGISVSGATGAVTVTNSGVTSVTGTAPVVSSGGATPAISMAAATTSVNGYLTSTDWNTFNNKSPAAGSASLTTTGTVTSGTWSASFGAVSGANLTSITGANVTGTVANATTSASCSGNASTATTASTANALNTSNNYQVNSLGVGTAGSGTAGEIRATNNVTAYYSSDRTLKENIQDIPNALEIAVAIGSKTFDWTDAYLEAHGGEDGYFVQKSDFGVIAQDVQKVFPIAVRTREDGTLAVDYEKLGTLAFAALGQLLKRVEALEAR